MSRVSSIEELVKQCYSLFKNSASRKLKLAAIAESFEEKTLRPRNIFSIKFLTSEESATEATLVDYRQLLQLTEQLKDDKSLSRDQRSNIKSIWSKLRDARSLVNLIALHDVLTEGISPYQKWGQLKLASSFERLFEKTKLYNRLTAISETKFLSPEKLAMIDEMIDFPTGTWKKTGQKVLYCPKTSHEMVTKVVVARASMAGKFQRAKESVHKKNDPPFLDQLSTLWDCRNWDTDALENNNNFTNFKEEFLASTFHVTNQSFLDGFDKAKLELEIISSINLVKKLGLLEKMMKENHIIQQ